MVSKLEIFRTVLTPSRNALVDDLGAYLNTCQKTYSNDTFQYQKIELDMGIKINAQQSEFQGMSVGNYIRLTQDAKVFYLFINDYDWTSQNSCRLFCSIDTINTFRDDLEWSPKTNVIRQHKDRFQVSPVRGVFTTKSYAIKVQAAVTYDQDIEWDAKDIIGTFNTSYEISVHPVSVGTCTVTANSITIDTVNGKVKGNFHIIVTGELPPMGLQYLGGTLRIKVGYDYFARKIDYVHEGETPQLYGGEQEDLLDRGDLDSWYLIYNTTTRPVENANATVETYMCKDSNINAILPASDWYKIDAANIATGITYIVDALNPSDSESKSWFFNKPEVYTSYSVGWNYGTRVCLAFRKKGSNLEVGTLKFAKTGIADNWELRDQSWQSNGNNDDIRLANINSSVTIYNYKGSLNPATSIAKVRASESTTNKISTEPTTIVIAGIDEIDKTTSTLVKIIKLPYCPINYYKNYNGVYEFKGQCEQKKLGDKLLIYIRPFIKLERKIISNILNPLKIVSEKVNLDLDVHKDRNIKNETKLYNSDYYTPKMVYDSFGFNFKLEDVNPLIDQPDKLTINFVPSRVFNSTFMVEYPDYITAKRDTQDYNNILVCSRNNEVPIYNSDYMNYIKNGYNYDKKARTMSAIEAGVSTALGIGQSVATPLNERRSLRKQAELKAALQGANQMNQQIQGNIAVHTAGTGLTSVATISAATNALRGAASGIFSWVNATESMNRKLQELSSQAISVSANDDIDILTAYSNNKLKLKTYSVSNKVKHDLFDKFYYTGYVDDNNTIPNFNSRYWFNYIECEPVFTGICTATYNKFIEDVKARYEAGVTVYHNHNGEYDWNQKLENWESAILNPVFKSYLIPEISTLEDVKILGSSDDGKFSTKFYGLESHGGGRIVDMTWVESIDNPDHKLVPALRTNWDSAIDTDNIYMFKENVLIEGTTYGLWEQYHYFSGDEEEPGWHSNRNILTNEIIIFEGE